MSHIEFDTQVGNLMYTLNQLRAGRDAVRFGHEQSDDDVRMHHAVREIIKHLLAKEFDNANDDELITGMEQYIETFIQTKNAHADTNA